MSTLLRANSSVSPSLAVSRTVHAPRAGKGDRPGPDGWVPELGPEAEIRAEILLPTVEEALVFKFPQIKEVPTSGEGGRGSCWQA